MENELTLVICLISVFNLTPSVSRESRVLSGRSLVHLAREVEQGLTLAIYLDLNDSTITGMGFDALAKGQSLVDITYKVLLLWKRRTSKYKDRQVSLN